VLTIAKMKVPHGKLQFTAPGIWLLILEEREQGALEPCRFGLVRTATTINAATNKRSMMTKINRRTLEPELLMMHRRHIDRSVYATAAARMPSTAPLERVARPANRMILAKRMEKRMSDIDAERNWKARKACSRRERNFEGFTAVLLSYSVL
jgi:hypothetical protein